MLALWRLGPAASSYLWDVEQVVIHSGPELAGKLHFRIEMAAAAATMQQTQISAQRGPEAILKC